MTRSIPGTAYRPLGGQTQPRMRAHDVICLHTMVGYLSSTDAMFKQNGYQGTESHFGVGGMWGGDLAGHLDGVVYQWQDLDYTADANFQSNYRVISIETADNAPRSAADILAWTPKQINSIIHLVATLCREFNIPAVMVPDSKPGRRGLAIHRQGIEHSGGVGRTPGWLVAGGERWSTSVGKECPGDRRAKQFVDVIIPGVQQVLAGKFVVTEEKDMQLDDKIKLSAAAAAAMSMSGSPRKKGEEVTVSYLLQWGGAGAYREWADIKIIKAQNAALVTQMAALSAAVKALAQNSPAAIQAAFATGQSGLARQLAELDVHLSLSDGA